MKGRFIFQPEEKFIADLQRLEGQLLSVVKEHMKQKTYRLGQDPQTLQFVHVQGSSGAFPASVLRLSLLPESLGLEVGKHLNTAIRRVALFDFLTRRFADLVRMQCRSNRGDEGSGTFQTPDLPQQVLARNIWEFGSDGLLSFLVRVSLPARRPSRLLAAEACEMLATELPNVLAGLREAVERPALAEHIAVVEDWEAIGGQMEERGLVAFIPEGALLPRRSGASDLPADVEEAVLFEAPPERRVTLQRADGGTIRGLGLPRGVTVIVGGGFHGKSTLLAALARSVYPHIPGDGRERVVTNRNAVFSRSEEGRSVRGVDIEPFIARLPDGRATTSFHTDNASGSSSQAASVVEAIWAGARVLFFDEDSSATNFLVRDPIMHDFVRGDPITPLVFHLRHLYEELAVSSVVVSGSSSQFLGIADCVIEMRRWLPHDRTADAASLPVTLPQGSRWRFPPSDPRRLGAGNFDPSYTDRKRNKTIPVRIKPLRGVPRILEYGDDRLDLQALEALVDADQVQCIGQALYHAHGHLPPRDAFSPSSLAEWFDDTAAQGLQVWQGEQHLYLARPRRLEFAGAINRARSLRLLS